MAKSMTEYDKLQAEIDVFKAEMVCLDTDCRKIQNA